MLKRKKGFSGFSDVSNSSWMYKYVMKIATLGFAEL
ncbi:MULTISPECIES: S-layer homology domain-containing protein [unclassified Paenibacillus]|nr:MULTISPECIES: S-layer homology domain-containing protein [unclassified Paenibacillus]